MEKNIKEISSTEYEVEFILTKEEVEPELLDAYKEAQQHIDLKGFRKGRVPIKLIKQYFGKKIEAETIEEISQKKFEEFMEEDKIKAVGTPKLVDLKTEDTEYRFRINYEILPEFELKGYTDLKIDEPAHIVSDEEIDKEINYLCRNSGELVDDDSVKNELYIVDINFQEIDEQTNAPIDGKEATDSKVFLDDEKIIPELKTRLLDKKVGDNFVFRPKDSDPYAEDKLFRLTIKNIQQLVPKEFTDKFVEEYSKGKFKTAQEYRDEVGFQLQEQWDEKSRQEMENQIVTKLVDLHDVVPPESVVENVIDAMVEDIKKQYEKTPKIENVDRDVMANDLRPLAARTVVWELIRNKIIEKEGIKVEDYDVDELLSKMPGIENIDPNTLKSTILDNKQFTDQIISKKVIDFLIEFAETNEVDFDEYSKKNEHHHDHEHDHHDHEHTETEDIPESNIDKSDDVETANT